MPSLIPKKLRRYKREYPYSHPVLFFFLEAAESLVKLGAVAIICVVSYFGLKNLLLNSDPDTDIAPRADTTITAVMSEAIKPVPSASVADEVISTSSDQKVATPDLNPAATNITKTTAFTLDNVLRDQDAIAWLTKLKASDFIIQFAATPDEQAIFEFTSDSMNGEAVVYPFKRTPSGRPVYGAASTDIYDSLESAQNALAGLPETLKDINPWIRPASQVQSAVANTL